MDEQDKKHRAGFQVSGPYSIPNVERDGIRPDVSTVSVASGYRGKLAFDYQGKIFVLDLETGELKQFRGIRAAMSPVWHPDGDHLAFGRANIHILNIHTGKFINMTSGTVGNHEEPSWDPTGKSLVYVRYSELWILDISTQKSIRIPITGKYELIYPSWSPDGKQIVFALIDKQAKPLQSQIYVVDTDCVAIGRCEPHQLTKREKASTQPSWSPDGKFITFRSEKGIFIMSADGSNQHQLSESKRGDFEPSWSPDGQYIVFTRIHEDTQSYLYIMKSDGSQVTPLSQEGLKGMIATWWMDLEHKQTE